MLNEIEIFPLRLYCVIFLEHKVGFAIFDVFAEHKFDQSVDDNAVHTEILVVRKYGYKSEIKPFGV